MTQLEREYFSTFTLERLKAFYRALSKKTNFPSEYDYDDYYNMTVVYNGLSYVTRKFRRQDGKVVEIKINKRKVRNAIEERETNMTKEEKRESFKPHRWNLYENGHFIDSFDSHSEAKRVKHKKTVEAKRNWLDLTYTLKRIDD